MKKALSAIFAIGILAATFTDAYCNDYGIIPEPASITGAEGRFKLKGASISAKGEQAEKVASILSSKIQEASGITLAVGGEGNIELCIDKESGLPAEGYSLEVSQKGIKAVGADEAGLFYAVQTIFQLLPPVIDSRERVRNADWSIPCVSIKDYPRFKWRGVMVDPCRHFISVQDIKKHIDVFAGYKINVLHLHLTDDQGWRIEIKKYPRLTEIGGWRTEFDGTKHGGFYTQEEIKDLVEYAAQRHITIVPEIEMPGHAIAAVRAYPELSCSNVKIDNFYTWGTTDKVFCPGKDHTFEFLEDVVAEVSALFPGEYFHIGGDECKKNEWEICPDCQARIKAEGLNADEHFSAEQKLQSYAVGRMEQILAKYGKKLVGWDEILEGGLSPNATVMSWQGEKGGIAAAGMGHDVVMTPSHEGMYLDSYQGDSKAEPLAFGRYITLEVIYNYNPVPEVLEKDGLAGRVLGVQGNLWSEYLYSLAQREYMLFPRALALAEIAWTPLDRKDFKDFARRTDEAAARLDHHNVNYHIPLPEQPGGSCSKLAFTDELDVEFATTRPEKMVYTLNGKEPGLRSKAYRKPLHFKKDGIIKIRTVLPDGHMSMVRTVEVRKEALAPAIKAEVRENGLNMRKTYGNFIRVEDYAGATDWESLEIEDFRALPTQETYPRDMRGAKFYAAEAEGYVNIRKSGVWRFNTDNDQLWIDGRLVVDNNGLVKRYSRNDGEIALEKGLHRIKVVFISNVDGGWTTARNKGDVNMRFAGEDEFHRLKNKDLFR